MKKITLTVFLGCLTLTALSGQDKPAWVDRPSSVYPAQQYVSAVGGGRDRTQAENNAKGSLAAFFKQSVSSRISITDRESQVNGRSTSSSDMSQSVEAVAALENLMGVEIKAVWNDTRTGTGWWAAAVMEKGRGRERYTAELNQAIGDINRLIDISEGVSFETLSKCQSARELLPRAATFALILNMLDGPDRQGDLDQLASKIDGVLNQARAIPVDVRVAGDKGGRVKAAFAKAFTALGFRTGTANSRYALVVQMSLEAAEQNRYFNTRYTVDAVLQDTRSGAELFTYNIASRESHPSSQTEADNRAVLGAVREIEEKFPQALGEYLGLQ